MPPKNKKVLTSKKGKEAGSTDSIGLFNSSAESPETASKTSEGRKMSLARESVQSKLSFSEKTTNMDTVIEKIETMHNLLIDTKTSLERKLDEKTDILTSAIYELQQENDSLKKMFEDNQKQIDDLRKENDDLRKNLQEFRERDNDLEQYSRRESVRIHGIQGDRRQENSQECEEKVLNILHSKLGLENIDSSRISAIHRVGRYNEGGKPRSVIVKFISRKDTVQVIKERRKLKGTRIVTDDLTTLNLQRLNRIKQHEAVTEAWSASGGRLFVKLKDTTVKEIIHGDTSNIK